MLPAHPFLWMFILQRENATWGYFVFYMEVHSQRENYLMTALIWIPEAESVT